MTQDLPPYPEYKDSALPWLGKIPAHWQEKRAKYFFREVDERSTTGEEELLSVSHVTGVTPRSQKNVTMFKAESYVGHKLCQPGDLVINTMWAWMAALGVAKQTGIVSPGYAVYRPRAPLVLASGFIDNLLRTQPYATEYLVRSTGIRASRLRLYPEQFLDIPVVCPPPEEQRQMLAYLSGKGGLISRFIRNKRRLIELLNEQKQAVVNRVVTRGVDPAGRAASSGMARLGEVAEGWKVVALRHLGTKFGSGSTPRGGAGVYRTSGIPLIRSQNVHFGALRLADVVFIAPETHAEMSATHLRSGDVLLNITGASIGRACVVPDDLGEANVNQHVCIIRPRRDHIHPEFLAGYLSTAVIQDEIYMRQNGASREGLSLKMLKALPILVPPIADQEKMRKVLASATSNLQEATRAASDEIELMLGFATTPD
jgi:type I restriction enzyme S subunit